MQLVEQKNAIYMHELPQLIEDTPDMDSFAVFSVLRWHGRRTVSSGLRT